MYANLKVEKKTLTLMYACLGSMNLLYGVRMI